MIFTPSLSHAASGGGAGGRAAGFARAVWDDCWDAAPGVGRVGVCCCAAAFCEAALGSCACGAVVFCAATFGGVGPANCLGDSIVSTALLSRAVAAQRDSSSFTLRSNLSIRSSRMRSRSLASDGAGCWANTVPKRKASARPHEVIYLIFVYCLAIIAFACAFPSSSLSWIILAETSAVTLLILPVKANGGR